MTQQLDPPDCLKRAREEMLFALDSLQPAEERLHKEIAEDLMVKAVHEIREHPERKCDWSHLTPPRESLP